MTPLLKLAILDVGQGDTIVVTCPETREAMVIDCVDANAVLTYLSQEKIRHLRSIILTHLHMDHCRGVYKLLAHPDLVGEMGGCELLSYNEIENRDLLETLIRDGDDHNSAYDLDASAGEDLRRSTYQNLLDWTQRHPFQYAVLRAQKGCLPWSGTLRDACELLHPYAPGFRSLELKGLNNTSGVLRIQGLGASALLMGDLEPAGWQILRNRYPDLRSDVLKFPHHGAWKDEDVDSLLDAIDPSIVVISVGTEGMRYKHPNKHVFNAIARRHRIRLLCTQVTTRCTTALHQKRPRIADLHQEEVDKHQRPSLNAKRGCPCAGTVVIELGSTPRVLQPTLHFHRDVIIEPHYEKAQCRKRPDGEIVGEGGQLEDEITPILKES